MSKIRRHSILQSQTSEPLIVVEENDDAKREGNRSSGSSEEGSPSKMNPFLLSPFAREVRKHSLPTPQCSGITASQVRRLSERGEASGPGPRQAEFLATLSTAPQITSGGRRHSVVTISRVPTAMFGKTRRDSVSRVLPPGRRESIACPPPSEPLGSMHNLHLDIMDDIVQARKVRLKLWTESNEKVCEVQQLDDENLDNVQRFTGSSSTRRYSDFVGTTLAPIPSSSKRRASELPTEPSKLNKRSGIVCSNTDLISILSSLSTSAMEIDRQCNDAAVPASAATKTDQKPKKLFKTTRSNSFDIAIIYKTKVADNDKTSTGSPSNWFVKRHQPKNDVTENHSTLPVISKEPVGKVVWDGRSGSMVDAHAFGSAIEDFLRQTTPATTVATPSPKKRTKLKSEGSAKKTAWLDGETTSATDANIEKCEASLCSTLKDLFVK